MTEPQEHMSVAVYEQIANLLRAWIVDQDISHPIRLPSEPELAKRHGVARGTIRQALDVLTREKLIERSPGRGTHAVPATISAWRLQRKPRAIAIVTRFMLELEQPATFYGQLYQGIALAAEKEGYRLTLKYLPTSHVPVGQQVEVPDPQQVAGVIMVGIVDDRVIRMHLDAGYPVVCVDYHAPDPRADILVVDCYGEGYQATRFLLDLGHRHLFYVGNCLRGASQLRQEPDAELFEAGCQRALREASYDTSLAVHYCGSKKNDVLAVADWIAGLRPRPTAGMIFADDVIFSLMPLLESRNMDCPRTVSLLGRMSHPVSGVCGMRCSPLRIGQRAIAMLLERTTGQREEPLRVATPSLLCHGSTVQRLSV